MTEGPQLGVKEKVAAWVLWRWLKKESPEMLARVLGNWQTSVAAVVVGVVTACHYYGLLDATQMNELMGVATTLGLLVAKDAATGSKPR